jgi:hypothetical protein
MWVVVLFFFFSVGGNLCECWDGKGCVGCFSGEGGKDRAETGFCAETRASENLKTLYFNKVIFDFAEAGVELTPEEKPELHLVKKD